MSRFLPPVPRASAAWVGQDLEVLFLLDEFVGLVPSVHVGFVAHVQDVGLGMQDGFGDRMGH